jgi:hypothetical protein
VAEEVAKTGRTSKMASSKRPKEEKSRDQKGNKA